MHMVLIQDYLLHLTGMLLNRNLPRNVLYSVPSLHRCVPVQLSIYSYGSISIQLGPIQVYYKCRCLIKVLPIHFTQEFLIQVLFIS